MVTIMMVIGENVQLIINDYYLCSPSLSISKYYGELNSTDLIRLEHVAAQRMIKLDITT